MAGKQPHTMTIYTEGQDKSENASLAGLRIGLPAGKQPHTMAIYTEGQDKSENASLAGLGIGLPGSSALRCAAF
jgi:hypothetical protein